jgi:hypothetical protein
MGRVVRGAKCPWGEMSVRRIVRGANCPWGELSVGRNVRGAKCPWGEMSWGELSWGEWSGNRKKSLEALPLYVLCQGLSMEAKVDFPKSALNDLFNIASYL